MATEKFLSNANGPSNHYAKFWSIANNNLKVRDFPIGLYGGWQKHTNHCTNLWENT